MAHRSRPARIDWIIRAQEGHLTASISNGPSGAFSFLQYVRVWSSSVTTGSAVYRTYIGNGGMWSGWKYAFILSISE